MGGKNGKNERWYSLRSDETIGAKWRDRRETAVRQIWADLDRDSDTERDRDKKKKRSWMRDGENGVVYELSTRYE